MGMQLDIKASTNTGAWMSALEKGADFAAAALAEQMLNDCRDSLIPKQEGTLRDSSRIEKPADGERDLVWDARDEKGHIYAGYQWFGMRADGSHVVKHYTTPGTSKMWVETAREQHGDDWQKVAENGLKKGMGQ